MAKGRMLTKSISTSRRLADLKTDSARLLYTWMIPHLDVEGRMIADPLVIKGLVVPRLFTMTPESINEYLADMVAVDLISLYRCDGDRYLELRKFADHQTLREDREAASKIPPPPEDAGSTPAEANLTQAKANQIQVLPARSPSKREPVALDENFEVFWRAYAMPAGRERGPKTKALQEWQRLSEADQRKAFYLLKTYMQETAKNEDGRYRKMPYLYLKERRWEQYLDNLPEEIVKKIRGVDDVE